VEQIKKFELLPLNWSIETGELTPKMSIKRKFILEKYKTYLNKIYPAPTRITDFMNEEKDYRIPFEKMGSLPQ
jgi:hypothetical protein